MCAIRIRCFFNFSSARIHTHDILTVKTLGILLRDPECALLFKNIKKYLARINHRPPSPDFFAMITLRTVANNDMHSKQECVKNGNASKIASEEAICAVPSKL